MAQVEGEDALCSTNAPPLLSWEEADELDRLTEKSKDVSSVSFALQEKTCAADVAPSLPSASSCSSSAVDDMAAAITNHSTTTIIAAAAASSNIATIANKIDLSTGPHTLPLVPSISPSVNVEEEKAREEAKKNSVSWARLVKGKDG